MELQSHSQLVAGANGTILGQVPEWSELDEQLLKEMARVNTDKEAMLHVKRIREMELAAARSRKEEVAKAAEVAAREVAERDAAVQIAAKEMEAEVQRLRQLEHELQQATKMREAAELKKKLAEEDAERARQREKERLDLQQSIACSLPSVEFAVKRADNDLVRVDEQLRDLVHLAQVVERDAQVVARQQKAYQRPLPLAEAPFPPPLSSTAFLPPRQSTRQLLEPRVLDDPRGAYNTPGRYEEGREFLPNASPRPPKAMRNSAYTGNGASPGAARQEAELLVGLLKAQQDRIDELRRLLLEGVPDSTAMVPWSGGQANRLPFPTSYGPERELSCETHVVRKPPTIKLGLSPGMYDLHVHMIQRSSAAFCFGNEQEPLSLRIVQAVVMPPHPSEPTHVQVEQRPAQSFLNVPTRTNFKTDISYATFSFPFHISPPGEYHMFLLEIGTALSSSVSGPSAWAVVCTDKINGPRAVPLRALPSAPLKALGDPLFASIDGCYLVVEISPASSTGGRVDGGKQLGPVVSEAGAIRALHANHEPKQALGSSGASSPFAAASPRQGPSNLEGASSLAHAFPPRPPVGGSSPRAMRGAVPYGPPGGQDASVPSPRRPPPERTPTKHRDLVSQGLPLSPAQQRQLDALDEAERSRRAAHAERIAELRRRWREEQEKTGKRLNESPIPMPPPLERHVGPKVVPVKPVAPAPLALAVSGERFDEPTSPLFLQVPGNSASPKSPTSIRRNSKLGNKVKPAVVEQRHSYPSASLSRPDLSPFIAPLDNLPPGSNEMTPLGASLSGNNFNSSGNFDSDLESDGPGGAAMRRPSKELHEGNPLEAAPSIVLEASSPPEARMSPPSNKEPPSVDGGNGGGGGSQLVVPVAVRKKGPRSKPTGVDGPEMSGPMNLSKLDQPEDGATDDGAGQKIRPGKGSKDKPAPVDDQRHDGSTNLAKSDLALEGSDDPRASLKKAGRGSKDKPASLDNPQGDASKNLSKSDLSLDDDAKKQQDEAQQSPVKIPPRDPAQEQEERARNAKAIADAVRAANMMHRRVHRDAERKRVEERRRQAAEALAPERKPIQQDEKPPQAPTQDGGGEQSTSPPRDKPPAKEPASPKQGDDEQRKHLANLQLKAMEELKAHQKRLEEQEKRQQERHQRDVAEQRLRRKSSVEDLRDRKQRPSATHSPTDMLTRPEAGSSQAGDPPADKRRQLEDYKAFSGVNAADPDDAGASADVEDERDQLARRRKEAEERKNRTRSSVQIAEQQYSAIKQAQDRQKREQERRRQEERRREAEAAEQERTLREKASSELARKLSESKLQRKRQEELRRQEEAEQERRRLEEENERKQREDAKKPENVLSRVLNRRDSSSERNSSDFGRRDSRSSFVGSGADGMSRRASFERQESNTSRRDSNASRRDSNGSRRDSNGSRRDSTGSRRNTFTVEQMKPTYRGPTNLGRAMIKTLLEDRRRSSIVSLDGDGAPVASRLPSPDIASPTEEASPAK